MLADAEKEILLRCAKKYNVSSVYVLSFPASVILGIDGFDTKVFFRFYGELIRGLSVPFEILDLSVKSRFSDYVLSEGTKIYG